MARKRARVLISGRVQGVAFRYYTRDEGNRLGLWGWVRNLDDGRVELLAEGEEPSVDALIAWCHEGPPAARVDGVDVSLEEPLGETGRFGIAR
jgi:acylphosphatase